MNQTTIVLTTCAPRAMIAEARDKLDLWLYGFPSPPRHKTWEPRLVRVQGRCLTYEVELQPLVMS